MASLNRRYKQKFPLYKLDQPNVLFPEKYQILAILQKTVYLQHRVASKTDQRTLKKSRWIAQHAATNQYEEEYLFFILQHSNRCQLFLSFQSPFSFFP
jgi:hypothetical protein